MPETCLEKFETKLRASLTASLRLVSATALLMVLLGALGMPWPVMAGAQTAITISLGMLASEYFLLRWLRTQDRARSQDESR